MLRAALLVLGGLLIVLNLGLVLLKLAFKNVDSMDLLIQVPLVLVLAGGDLPH